MIGYAFCGSFCTLEKSYKCLEEFIKNGEKVIPIVSENVYKTDTRFTKAKDFIDKVERLCQAPVIHTIDGAEPLGPKIALDMLILSPCTGNTLAKISNGITDTAVTMAAKAHLRSNRKLVIALATNDALSANLKNIASLLCRKNVYFVPMRQDDTENKPHSLICDFSLLFDTVKQATNSKQLQPIFLGK